MVRIPRFFCFLLKNLQFRAKGKVSTLALSLAEPCDPEQTLPRQLHGLATEVTPQASGLQGSQTEAVWEVASRSSVGAMLPPAGGRMRGPPGLPSFPRSSLVLRRKAPCPRKPLHRAAQVSGSRRLSLTIRGPQLKFHLSSAYASIRRRLDVLFFAVGKTQARRLRVLSRVPLPALARARTEKWASA